FSTGPWAVQPIPAFVAFRRPPPDSGLSGRGLSGLRISPGGDIGEEVVIGKMMLTLCQPFQVRRELAGTKGRAFLNTDTMLEKERQVGADNVPDRGCSLFDAV